MIEIYLLEQFIAVAEHDTLLAASQSLHLTQPALTRSMQKLEREFGVSLFIRTKNKIELNENGKLAVTYAKRILSENQEMIHRVIQLERANRTIAIGSCAPFPMQVMQSVIPQYLPALTVSSELTSEEHLLYEMQNDTYTIYILSRPIVKDGYQCVPLFKEHLYLSVMPAHPAANKKCVSFQEIDGESFVVYDTLGIWSNLAKKNLPHSHFIEQRRIEDVLSIRESSSLPAFDTDVANYYMGKQSVRKSIPISDKEATLSFYALCKNKDYTRLQNVFSQINHTFSNL